MRRKEERSKQGQTNKHGKALLPSSFPPPPPFSLTQLINCTSKESFLEPRVHCVGDCNGFQSIHPSSDQAAWYQGRHLPHIRSGTTCTCTCTMYPRQLIFSRKSDCLGCAVLLCLVCLFDLACFFLSSFSSLI